MESKQAEHESAIHNAHEMISSLNTTLDSTRNELKKEILHTKTELHDKMTLLEVQHNNANETLTEDISSLQGSSKPALDERNEMNTKIGAHKKAIDNAHETISSLKK